MLASLKYGNSDRVMRAYQSNRRAVESKERNILYRLVMDSVHPAYWSEYPPSLKEIRSKAYTMGVNTLSDMHFVYPTIEGVRV